MRLAGRPGDVIGFAPAARHRERGTQETRVRTAVGCGRRRDTESSHIAPIGHVVGYVVRLPVDLDVVRVPVEWVPRGGIDIRGHIRGNVRLTRTCARENSVQLGQTTLIAPLSVASKRIPDSRFMTAAAKGRAFLRLQFWASILPGDKLPGGWSA